MAALGACQSARCSNECELKCGGWGLLAGPQLGHIESVAGCESCLTSTACQQLAKCVADEGCLTSRFCGNACIPLDWACLGNCGYPAATFGYSYPSDAGDVLSNFDLLQQCAGPCQSGSDWSCVPGVTWPLPTSPTISGSIRIVDVNGNPVAGVTVSACTRVDNVCSGLVASATTGADGVATITVIPERPTQFDGYFTFSATGYLPTMLFLYPYLAQSVSTSPAAIGTISLFTLKDLQQGYVIAHVPLDAGLSTLFTFPFDCEGLPAPGVSFSGPPGEPFYYVDNLPTIDASATTAFGSDRGGGFANVDPGALTLSSSVDGGVFSTLQVGARSGGVTYVFVVPTP